MPLTARSLIGFSLLGVTALFAACSSSPSDSDASSGGIGNRAGSGGAIVNGGSASGGSLASGGSTGGTNPSTGGSTPIAGSSSGGSTATGGTVSSDGGIGTAGANSGGTASSGGSAGSSSPGGNSNSGGAPNTGGTTERGGAGGNGGSFTAGRQGSAGNPTGGAGGAMGGASATGGTNAGGAGTFQPCPASGICKIMPLGDSITDGTGFSGGYRVELFAKAVADNKNITFVGSLSNGPTSVSGVTFPKSHEGHFGWTISQVDDLIPDPALNPAPHIVLLHLGTNDINQNMTSGAPERLGSLIDQIITKLPSALIVVAKIIPEPSQANGITTFNNAVPQIVQTRANAGKHIILVDQFSGFPSSELGDGVHPNQAGYARMAGVWYTAIKGYLH
jgi:lysophospholipase L1-like esterase